MTLNKVTLTPDQDKANHGFLDFLMNDENFFVIHGPAGTGKSFLIRHLLETFYSNYSAYCLLLQHDIKTFDIKVTATTNKAVNVVNEFLEDLIQKRDDLSVCTIYSLLGVKVVNDRNTGKTTLSYDNKSGSAFTPTPGVQPLVFIDEAFFINQEFQDIIVTLLKDQANAKIVYIGDEYQLAPVGQLCSPIDALQCDKVSLDEIMRNSGHILKTGTQFRRTVQSGIFTPIEYNDVDVIHVDGPEFQQRIEKSFSDPDWHPNKSKILAWTNQRVQEYNSHIRGSMNRPALFDIGEIVVTNNFIKGSTSFTRSVDSEVTITDIDKQGTSNYGVKGYMIELDHSHVGFLPANFQDAKTLLKTLAVQAKADRSLWKKFFEIKESWLDLRAVYASSVHKSQGSTYDTVFLDLTNIGQNWNANDVARLLYVGFTRASHQVICYGHLPDWYCQ